MKLILAADKNWAIGKDGDLLLHISGDLKYFKERTLDKVVVMGRVTLESLPGKKPLPKRTNIVLTTNQGYSVDGAIMAHSLKELDDVLKQYNTDDVLIIGGEKIYKEFLPFCDTCYITKIYDEFPADKHFINLDEMPEFEITWRSQVQEENGVEYEFFEYKRK
ncbi:MAG: dihydrofolate reductase [Anaerovoracaceae bacterium]